MAMPLDTTNGPLPVPDFGADQARGAMTLEFGPFEFSVASGDLRSADRTLRLAPQPATVLSMLLQREGGVVTRQELSTALWPHGFIEADLGINHCIRQVRRALLDDAKNPVFVETLRRRGYRMIVPVRERPTTTGEVSISRPLIVREAWRGTLPTLHSRPTEVLRRLGSTGLTSGLTLVALLFALTGLIPLVLFLPLFLVLAAVGVFRAVTLERPLVLSDA